MVKPVVDPDKEPDFPYRIAPPCYSYSYYDYDYDYDYYPTTN